MREIRGVQPDELEGVRKLFTEYGEYVCVRLDFRNFDEEMATGPEGDPGTRVHPPALVFEEQNIILLGRAQGSTDDLTRRGLRRSP